MKYQVKEKFDLTKKVAVITGGAGFLGQKHAEAIAEMGGITVLLDLEKKPADKIAGRISKYYGVTCLGIECDITKEEQLETAKEALIREFKHIDILINNAAIDPKVEQNVKRNLSRLENFSIKQWNQEIAVGLTGAMLCSKVFGYEMARKGKGVILNITSDLGVIAPDQRLYKSKNIPEENQPVKPVTYSVIKHGLIGLTKYLATYWADKGIRANSISPGGIYANQDLEFVKKLTNLIPLSRMAHEDEYKAAIIFIVSDASSYMTGANLVIDGGRTCW